MFCRVLGVVLCSTALTVYFASRSIGTVVVTTLACSLLLQLAYFASVLFLIWRSGHVSRAGQRAEHFGSCKGVGCQPPDNKKAGYQPPDYKEVRDESSDVPQFVPTGGISLLR
ncbi:exopolysaccharide production repressor protein [Mesorhizobium sp. LSJC269B00]|uniref:exopolysaccharide production repressor protein n=1 Tax=Mesorhizobium sp. LSJC269B00 TaxID=1287326 RepID=UPI001FD91DE8|nr:exopolysaccharide production repressor protein [Mesorhizobium sp. LSJC269B00]